MVDCAQGESWVQAACRYYTMSSTVPSGSFPRHAVYIAVQKAPSSLMGHRQRRWPTEGTESKKKELEELVVVLFVKVEFPNPSRLLELHPKKTAGTPASQSSSPYPAEYPKEINASFSEIIMTTGTLVWWRSGTGTSSAPGPTIRQSTLKPVNAFTLSVQTSFSCSLWFIPFDSWISTLRCFDFNIGN